MTYTVLPTKVPSFLWRGHFGKKGVIGIPAMDRYVDETSHVIICGKFENNKKYKEQTLKEIIAAICALLNTKGGKVEIYFEIDSKIPVEGSPFFYAFLVIRILEQSMISIIGLNQTVLKINFLENEQSITIVIKKSESLITTNYNLYLPSQKQVVQVYSWEPPQKVMDSIINRNKVEESVQHGSHCKQFLEGKHCGLYESKMCQLKNLKAEQSKRTRIADRMTGKGNKFSCYVSAFANYRGGHMYYGITPKGVIAGEKISNEDISDIIKKVEKAINKMIWPKEIGQPKQGEHWEIFFEPVLDENFKPIPSTFVIVIFIAPCLGGVFTEEPECYEMMEGKVQKMSFFRWEKRILHPYWPGVDDGIPSTVKRITWSSSAVRNAFISGGEKLRQHIGNGQWDAFFKECKVLEEKSKSHDLKILVLLQIVKAHYRRGEFEKANESLEDYEKILPQTQNRLFFEVMKMYLNAALYRAEGNKDKLEIFLTGALEKAELIEPGLVTATVYTFAGSVTDLISSPENISPAILSIKALQHVKCSPHAREDIHLDKKQKAHINLATFYLGCNISGQPWPTKKNVDKPCLDAAKDSIMDVRNSVLEGKPLSNYYEVQLNLVNSVYNYRRSQAIELSPDEKTRYLDYGLDYAKKAERLAANCEFVEMLEWSKANRILCTKK